MSETDASLAASTFVGGRADHPLRVDEAASLLRLTPQAVTAMIERGELCATKIGKSWMIWLSYEGLFSRAKLEQQQRREAAAEAAKAKAEAAKAKSAAGPTREELEAQIAALERDLAALPAKVAALAEDAKQALVDGDKSRADTLASELEYARGPYRALLINQREDKLRQLAALSPENVLAELRAREANLRKLVHRATVDAATDQPGRAVGELDPARVSSRRLWTLQAELASVREELAKRGAPVPVEEPAPAMMAPSTFGPANHGER